MNKFALLNIKSDEYFQTSYSLPEGNLIPIPINTTVEAPQNNSRFWTNKKYTLQGDECEDFNMPVRVYICKGVVDEVSGIQINSVVMKQDGDNDDTIFSLTKLDCKLLGIPYEKNLQLFPKNLEWTRLTEENADSTRFDANNLGTYPATHEDGTIRKMHVFIGNIRRVGKSNMVLMPDVLEAIQEAVLARTIRFKFKDPNLAKSTTIISMHKNATFFYDDEKKGIDFMLYFGKGIKPEVFEGKNIDDIFNVSWQPKKQVVFALKLNDLNTM